MVEILSKNFERENWQESQQRTRRIAKSYTKLGIGGTRRTTSLAQNEDHFWIVADPLIWGRMVYRARVG